MKNCKLNAFSLVLSLYCVLFFNTAQAVNNIKITQAWARASAPGQTVGAAYMTITSIQNTTLFSVNTSAADAVEIHSMTMTNGVMKMRMLEQLEIEAGKPYKLAPGGFHLMLFDLKQALKKGQAIQLTLSFKDKANKISIIKVTAPIKAE